jgi:predicted nucleotidyltransferase
MASVAAPVLTVPAPHRQAVEQFVSRVAEALPSAAILAYGSAVRGGFIAGQSDLNLLVVLPEVTPNSLATIGEATAAGRKHGLSPVVLASGELAPLAAEAPLVLWDIADRRLLLHGADPIADLEFELSALWHQLTFELRDKLLGLRQVQVSGQRPKPADAFSRRVATSLLHLLRAALRLYGRPAAQNRVAAIGDVARHLKLDLPTLQRFHSACYGDDAKLLRDVERFIADGQALLTAALAKLSELDADTLPVAVEQEPEPAADEVAEHEAAAEADEDAGDETVAEGAREADADAGAAQASEDDAEGQETDAAEADPESADDPEAEPDAEDVAEPEAPQAEADRAEPQAEPEAEPEALEADSDETPAAEPETTTDEPAARDAAGSGGDTDQEDA